MRFDEQTALDVLAETSAPVLRFFRWQPWAVSLGFHQPEDAVNREACRERGFDVVRRPTGGRAILHAEELTYSVVLPLGKPGLQSMHEAYQAVNMSLLRGLRLFGVDADYQRSQSVTGPVSSVPCFSTSARYEIEWRGRKLVGSAQRRYQSGHREAVLQHGSILTGPAHKEIAELLSGVDSSRVRLALDQKTVDLGEATGHAVDYGILADCLRKGFEEVMGASFEEQLEPYTAHEAVHA